MLWAVICCFFTKNNHKRNKYRQDKADRLLRNICANLHYTWTDIHLIYLILPWATKITKNNMFLPVLTKSQEHTLQLPIQPLFHQQNQEEKRKNEKSTVYPDWIRSYKTNAKKNIRSVPRC